MRGTDGDVSFTVSRNHSDFNFTYNAFLLDISDGTDYGYLKQDIAGGDGDYRFPGETKYKREADQVQGPEAQFNNAIAQLNAAAELAGFMRYGQIKEITGNETPDFLAYYFRSTLNKLGGNGHDGTNFYARVDPVNCNYNNVTILAVWLEEIFELCGDATKLGGKDTRFTITNYSNTGNLNEVGKDYWAALLVMSPDKIGVSNTANSASTALKAMSIDGSIGDVDIGINANGARVGYNGKNIRASTNVSIRNKQL